MTTVPAMVAIRKGRREDAAAIAALADELRAHVGDPTGHLTEVAILRDGFGAEPEFDLLVADDGAVVGYALFYEAYEPAYAARGLYLADLCVTQARRGRGIGRHLIAAVEDAARSRGRTFIWWLCNPKNQTALDFYRALNLEAIVPSVIHVRIFSSGQSST